MRWLPLVIVLVWSSAAARPVRIDDEFFRDDVRFRKGRKPKPYPPPCKQTTSWRKYTKCQLKGLDIEVIQDQPTLKLIAYKTNYSTSKVIALHFLSDKAWVQSGFYTEVNATTELLGYRKAGERYRLDVGYATPTWVTLDEVSTRPALLRRQFTYFCSPTAGCLSVMTACDVIVHGKAVSSFRGEPVWEGNNLKVRGNASATNRYCTKPPNLIDVSDE